MGKFQLETLKEAAETDIKSPQFQPETTKALKKLVKRPAYDDTLTQKENDRQLAEHHDKVHELICQLLDENELKILQILFCDTLFMHSYGKRIIAKLPKELLNKSFDEAPSLLFLATQWNQFALCNLIMVSADVELEKQLTPNSQGQSALDVAFKNNNESIINLLINDERVTLEKFPLRDLSPARSRLLELHDQGKLDLVLLLLKSNKFPIEMDIINDLLQHSPFSQVQEDIFIWFAKQASPEALSEFLNKVLFTTHDRGIVVTHVEGIIAILNTKDRTLIFKMLEIDIVREYLLDIWFEEFDILYDLTLYKEIEQKEGKLTARQRREYEILNMFNEVRIGDTSANQSSHDAISKKSESRLDMIKEAYHIEFEEYRRQAKSQSHTELGEAELERIAARNILQEFKVYCMVHFFIDNLISEKKAKSVKNGLEIVFNLFKVKSEKELYEQYLELGDKAFVKHLETLQSGDSLAWTVSIPTLQSLEQSNASYRAYFNNPMHTAARYLTNPNPLMHPQAYFVIRGTFGGGTAAINDKEYILMSMLWLAARDESALTGVKGETVENRKELFAAQMAEVARQHNRDERTVVLPDGSTVTKKNDDLTLDKPSCSMGVRTNLSTVAELLHSEKIKAGAIAELNVDLIQQLLKEFVYKSMQSYYKEHPERTILLKIALNQDQSREFEDEEDCDKVLQHAYKYIDFQLTTFDKQLSETYPGYIKINWNKDRQVTILGEKYRSYQSYVESTIQNFSTSPLVQNLSEFVQQTTQNLSIEDQVIFAIKNQTDLFFAFEQKETVSALRNPAFIGRFVDALKRTSGSFQVKLFKQIKLDSIFQKAKADETSLMDNLMSQTEDVEIQVLIWSMLNSSSIQNNLDSPIYADYYERFLMLCIKAKQHELMAGLICRHFRDKNPDGQMIIDELWRVHEWIEFDISGLCASIETLELKESQAKLLHYAIECFVKERIEDVVVINKLNMKKFVESETTQKQNSYIHTLIDVAINTRNYSLLPLNCNLHRVDNEQYFCAFDQRFITKLIDLCHKDNLSAKGLQEIQNMFEQWLRSRSVGGVQGDFLTSGHLQELIGLHFNTKQEAFNFLRTLRNQLPDYDVEANPIHRPAAQNKSDIVNSILTLSLLKIQDSPSQLGKATAEILYKINRVDESDGEKFLVHDISRLLRRMIDSKMPAQIIRKFLFYRMNSILSHNPSQFSLSSILNENLMIHHIQEIGFDFNLLILRLSTESFEVRCKFIKDLAARPGLVSEDRMKELIINELPNLIRNSHPLSPDAIWNWLELSEPNRYEKISPEISDAVFRELHLHVGWTRGIRTEIISYLAMAGFDFERKMFGRLSAVDLLISPNLIEGIPFAKYYDMLEYFCELQNAYPMLTKLMNDMTDRVCSKVTVNNLNTINQGNLGINNRTYIFVKSLMKSNQIGAKDVLRLLIREVDRVEFLRECIKYGDIDRYAIPARNRKLQKAILNDLLDKGIDNGALLNILKSAIFRKRSSWVSTILNANRVDLTQRTEKGLSVLNFFLQVNDVASLRKTLINPKLHFLVDEGDSVGYTPLMRAAQQGNKEMVLLMLDKSEHPKICNEKGESALSICKKTFSKEDFVEIVAHFEKTGQVEIKEREAKKRIP